MAAGQGLGEEVKSGITIRNCEGIDELKECVQLQKDVWQFADADLVPLRLYVVSQKIGGQVIGAYDGKKLVGFAMSIPGFRAGRSYLHSHMLAVLPELRNVGLGRQIKLFQREDALAQGYDLIEWTFDPLEIKNSHLNIERLGAIARRYNVNQYGNFSSPLQGGLPTDRLVAEWWLKSKRVTRLLAGNRDTIQPKVIVDVPAQIYEWKAAPQTRPLAIELQDRNRKTLMESFTRGLAVVGYERDEQRNGRFLLARWNEEQA
jgi:predicted GNAT superfamily acetyltransferase